MNINDIVLSIKKINGDIYLGEAEFDTFSCQFNPPINDDEICNFEKIFSCKIPDDFKEFLKISNGLSFFNSSDFQLYSLNQIKEKLLENDYLKGVYPIGYFLEDEILIKSDEINNDYYIYVGDVYSIDEFYKIEYNFTLFLDRLLSSNINNFWRWFEPNEYCYLKN